MPHGLAPALERRLNDHLSGALVGEFQRDGAVMIRQWLMPDQLATLRQHLDSVPVGPTAVTTSEQSLSRQLGVSDPVRMPITIQMGQRVEGDQHVALWREDELGQCGVAHAHVQVDGHFGG